MNKKEMKKMKKEIRAFSFEVRAEKDEQHGAYLSGRPIVFNEKTDLGLYDEIISSSALATTDLKDVRFLVNHNTDMIPLARSRHNTVNSTMQMVVDELGLTIRVNLDVDNNSEARALYSAVERGDISGMSFMFTVDGESWEDVLSDHPTRTILSIGKVFEVSAVTFPAYEQTSIQSRGLTEALEGGLKSLENERRKLSEASEKRLELEKLKFKVEMEI